MRELGRTLVALGLLLALALAWRWAAPGEAPAEGPVRVLALEPASLVEVQVERDRASYALYRAPDGGFRLSVPDSVEASWPADPAAVDAFLESLCRLRAERALPSLDAAEDTGLDAPAARLSWRSPTGAGSLRVGSPNRVSATGYVAVEGDPRLFSVPQARLTPLLAPPQTLRDRSILRVPFAPLRTLSFTRADGKLTLARAGDGLFVARGPTPGATTPVFPSRLAELCDELTALRAEAFFEPRPDEGARYGLDAPGLLVEATFDPPLPPVGLALGGRAPDTPMLVYARVLGERSPALGLRGDTLQFLTVTLDELRDRSPFSMPGEPDFEVVVSEAEPSRRLAQTAPALAGPRFLDRTGRATTVDASPFLDELARVRARSYRRLNEQDLTPYGLELPLFRVALVPRSGAPRRFAAGRARSGRAYLLLPDRAIAEVDPKLLVVLAEALREHGVEPQERG